ncbi:hypothetical protein HAX54_024920 [Datura stramonium]|uniref:Uncharacterized protein n=1 Tax=Datura stramonium TaxID=4076 RepID=A0ABS8V0M8_DATST|nr:hypothetical protein [Datura stramonium]
MAEVMVIALYPGHDTCLKDPHKSPYWETDISLWSCFALGSRSTSRRLRFNFSPAESKRKELLGSDSKTGEISQLEKELEDEIKALENQRDELEAALKKVANAFSSLLKVCVWNRVSKFGLPGSGNINNEKMNIEVVEVKKGYLMQEISHPTMTLHPLWMLFPRIQTPRPDYMSNAETVIPTPRRRDERMSEKSFISYQSNNRFAESSFTPPRHRKGKSLDPAAELSRLKLELELENDSRIHPSEEIDDWESDVVDKERLHFE